MSVPNIKLNSGHEMPQVGFGLWKVDTDCPDVVYNAVKNGYRLFDGACGTYCPCFFVAHHLLASGLAWLGSASLLRHPLLLAGPLSAAQATTAAVVSATLPERWCLRVPLAPTRSAVRRPALSLAREKFAPHLRSWPASGDHSHPSPPPSSPLPPPSLVLF